MLRVMVILVSLLLMAARMPAMRMVPWQVVEVPTDNILLDIAFTESNPDHGWIVGDKGTLLETRDGGINWQERVIQSSNPDYYLRSISFSGSEGWIVGEPKVMLHTNNGGDTWSQILLSSQLPGEPLMITAMGPETAELVTNIGAIYRTEDAGAHWHSQVDDAIGLLRNIDRNPEDGSYLAVSSRGSFYFLYSPSTGSWQPFNRDSSRRIQNMGFGPDGTAWKLNQGAEIAFTDDYTSGEWSKPVRPGQTLSFGYLGAAFQNDHDLWVVGGGGTLLHSPDQGQTWEKARKLSKVPANFYVVTFPQPGRGFVLGQRGTLLRYIGDA